MEGELLLPLYLYRFIRLDFVTINLVVILDYTIIILGGKGHVCYVCISIHVFGIHKNMKNNLIGWILNDLGL